MSRTPQDRPLERDEKTPGETFTRDGETMSLVEEFASDTLGALAIEPRWFTTTSEWVRCGNTITTFTQLYGERGELSEQHYRVTLTVEPVQDPTGDEADTPIARDDWPPSTSQQ